MTSVFGALAVHASTIRAVRRTSDIWSSPTRFWTGGAPFQNGP